MQEAKQLKEHLMTFLKEEVAEEEDLQIEEVRRHIHQVISHFDYSLNH
jgi:hypothetical protein